MPEEKSKSERPLPDEAYLDLALILSHADKLDQICESVEKTKDFLSLPKVAKAVSEKTGLDESEANRIVGSLVAFHRICRGNKLDVETFLEWLGNGFTEFARDKGKEALIESWEKAHVKIRAVLDEGSAFGILQKANELVYAHQNLLTEARLLTDLRPVYDRNINKMLRMVVTHQMVLKYFDGSSQKRIYIALDANDVEQLRRQCERAKQKADVAAKGMDECDWDTNIAGANDG